MNQVLRRLLLSFFTLCVTFISNATDFIDMSAPTKFITYGVRAGMNISNLTASKEYFELENRTEWGKGFDIGAVADIYIRNFISLQPGIFFETRENQYFYTSSHYIPVLYNSGEFIYREITQSGKTKTCNLMFPSLVRTHFNLGENVKWNIDAGLYYNIRLSCKGRPLIYYTNIEDGKINFEHSKAGWHTAELGYMFGMGFTFFNHYNISAHYGGGLRHAWRNEGMKGNNKSWRFTLGYDF